MAKKEITELKKKAEAGDINAQYKLGLLYFNENQGTQTQEGYKILDKAAINGRQEGIKWLDIAANSGHLESQIFLGDYFYKRPYISYRVDDDEDRTTTLNVNNVEKAIYYYKLIKQISNPMYYYYIGHAHYLLHDFSAAMIWHEKAAELGYKDSFIELGRIYRDVVRDSQTAYKWFYTLYIISNYYVPGTFKHELKELENKLGADATKKNQTEARELSKKINLNIKEAKSKDNSIISEEPTDNHIEPEKADYATKNQPVKGDLIIKFVYISNSSGKQIQSILLGDKQEVVYWHHDGRTKSKPKYETNQIKSIIQRRVLAEVVYNCKHNIRDDLTDKNYKRLGKEISGLNDTLEIMLNIKNHNFLVADSGKYKINSLFPIKRITIEENNLG